jgi:hypothetical protein
LRIEINQKNREELHDRYPGGNYLPASGIKDEIVSRRTPRELPQQVPGFATSLDGLDPDGMFIGEPHKHVKLCAHAQNDFDKGRASCDPIRGTLISIALLVCYEKATEGDGNAGEGRIV